jgi:hypothetical protein
VLIMNVDPFGGARARFSDAVDYKFRIRPIDDAKTLVPGAAASEESIVCTFAGGSIFEAKQDATCQFNLKKKTDAVKFATRGGSFKAGGSGTKDGIRVFAGVRSDPWFLNLKRTIMYSTGMQVPKTAESNSLQGGNVLSIVIEVPKDQLSGPLLAVTAQTVGRKSP